MPSKPIELLPEVAKVFVADMRAFFAAKSNTETAQGKFEHKERTLEQAGFGHNQHVHPADNIAAQTPLLSPAEIWRR
jgi:hypothetical protein